jgi:esterase/lipase
MMTWLVGLALGGVAGAYIAQNYHIPRVRTIVDETTRKVGEEATKIQKGGQ